MGTKTKLSSANSRKLIPLRDQDWSPEKFQAFAGEIDALREEILGKMGKEDVAYVRRVSRISQVSEAVGRALIHFSLDPLTWSAGVLALWVHKQLDSIEIGHHALHGCWDGLKGAERFDSKTFRWNTPIEEESWKKGHNELHHFYTNIIGRDPDANYGFLRVSEQTPWRPFHAFQILQLLASAPLFGWLLNPYFTGFADLLRPSSNEGFTDQWPDKKPKTIFRAARQSAKKLLPYFFRNYVFWPALAGPLWWKVFVGNMMADGLRNIYSMACIYPGHFGDDLQYHDKAFKPHGRGEWYKSQIETTHDFSVSQWVSYLCGAMDYQIEHHLFPKMPPNRLREVQPKIEKICKKYGVYYSRESWAKTLTKAFKRIWKMSIPGEGAWAKALTYTR